MSIYGCDLCHSGHKQRHNDILRTYLWCHEHGKHSQYIWIAVSSHSTGHTSASSCWKSSSKLTERLQAFKLSYLTLIPASVAHATKMPMSLALYEIKRIKKKMTSYLQWSKVLQWEIHLLSHTSESQMKMLLRWYCACTSGYRPFVCDILSDIIQTCWHNPNLLTKRYTIHIYIYVHIW